MEARISEAGATHIDALNKITTNHDWLTDDIDQLHLLRRSLKGEVKKV